MEGSKVAPSQAGFQIAKLQTATATATPPSGPRLAAHPHASPSRVRRRVGSPHAGRPAGYPAARALCPASRVTRASWQVRRPCVRPNMGMGRGGSLCSSVISFLLSPLAPCWVQWVGGGPGLPCSPGAYLASTAREEGAQGLVLGPWPSGGRLSGCRGASIGATPAAAADRTRSPVHANRQSPYSLPPCMRMQASGVLWRPLNGGKNT